METHRDQSGRTEFKHAPRLLHMQPQLPTEALRLGHLRCQHTKGERCPVLVTCAQHTLMGLCTHKCLAGFAFFLPFKAPHTPPLHAACSSDALREQGCSCFLTSEWEGKEFPYWHQLNVNLEWDFFLFSKLLLTVCQHTGKLFLAEKMACLSSQRLT